MGLGEASSPGKVGEAAGGSEVPLALAAGFGLAPSPAVLQCEVCRQVGLDHQGARIADCIDNPGNLTAFPFIGRQPDRLVQTLRQSPVDTSSGMRIWLGMRSSRASTAKGSKTRKVSARSIGFASMRPSSSCAPLRTTSRSLVRTAAR